MAWTSVAKMIAKRMTPLDVYDANGMIILRKITGFDIATGEVESLVMDRDGVVVEEPTGELKRRREFFPAPLTWRKVHSADVERHKNEYWDLQRK